MHANIWGLRTKLPGPDITLQCGPAGDQACPTERTQPSRLTFKYENMPKDYQTFEDNPQHGRQGLKQVYKQGKSKAIQSTGETPGYHHCPLNDYKKTLLP